SCSASSRSGAQTSSVTNTSPCWNGFMVPGSTLMYGSSFCMVTRRPRAFIRRPSDAAVRPLPSDEATPPVTKMCFAKVLDPLWAHRGGRVLIPLATRPSWGPPGCQRSTNDRGLRTRCAKVQVRALRAPAAEPVGGAQHPVPLDHAGERDPLGGELEGQEDGRGRPQQPHRAGQEQRADHGAEGVGAGVAEHALLAQVEGEGGQGGRGEPGAPS